MRKVVLSGPSVGCQLGSVKIDVWLPSIARAAFDAWNRGDHDAVLRVWDEGAEFYPLRAQLERRAYRGRDGLRRFFVELAEEWQEVRFEIDEIRDTGGQIVGLGRFQARGKGSGVEIDVPLGMVGVVRDKKVVYSRFFTDPAEALGAAGLSE
jgi:ketosteroid isomerase-like protein